jgi:hypothetical protein
VLLRVAVPYLLQRLSQKAQTMADDDCSCLAHLLSLIPVGSSLGHRLGVSDRVLQFVKQLSGFAGSGVLAAHRLHLAFFFVAGGFYHLSKRISNIGYVCGTDTLPELMSVG